MRGQVKVGRREATLVLSKRFAVRLSGIGPALGGAFGDIYTHIEAHGISTAGPPFVIYHATPRGDDPFEVEVCAPVAAPATTPATVPEGWRPQVLPAGLFATLLHVGPYRTIGTAYEELEAWLASHDLAMSGPPREVYLSEPDVPPEETRTVVELPVVESPVAVGAS